MPDAVTSAAMRGLLARYERLTKIAGALSVGMLATVASLYLLTLGQERFEPLEVATLGPDSMAAPGAPVDSQIEIAEDSAEPAPEAIEEKARLDQSVHVADYLEQNNMEPAEAEEWGRAFAAAAHGAMMQAGHDLSLFKDPETGEIRGLQYDISEQLAVAEEALGSGVVLATEEPIRYVSRVIPIAFAIHDGLEIDAARNQLPKKVIEQLAEAFNFKHRLEALKFGAAVKLIYEERVSRDGQRKLCGDLQAAQLDVGRRTFSAFRFRDEHGIAHFYDEQGKPLGPQFLRYPVAFQYISSGFSAARFHPILHRFRRHVGVDLVAHYGTPVKAVADGRISFSDWEGELGRCVRVDHPGDLSSLYGHLSRISPAIRPGVSVHTGQVIGWVGSSGLATGPHLHFALVKDGTFINPLSVKFGRGSDISLRTRAVFEKMKREHLTALGRLPHLADHAVSVSEPKPPISPLTALTHVELKSPKQPDSASSAPGGPRPRSSHHLRVTRAANRDVELGAGSL